MMSRMLTPLALGFWLAGSTAMAAAPQPSDAFRYFDGNWRCDGVFPSNGAKLSSTMSFHWSASTGALEKQHDDLPPHGYYAVELWAGASHGEAQNMIADVTGGVRLFTSPGWIGDTLTWARDIDATHKERFAYARLGPDTMRVDWATSSNGAAFTVGDTLTCTRGKS